MRMSRVKRVSSGPAGRSRTLASIRPSLNVSSSLLVGWVATGGRCFCGRGPRRGRLAEDMLVSSAGGRFVNKTGGSLVCVMGWEFKTLATARSARNFSYRFVAIDLNDSSNHTTYDDREM